MKNELGVLEVGMVMQSGKHYLKELGKRLTECDQLARTFDCPTAFSQQHQVSKLIAFLTQFCMNALLLATLTLPLVAGTWGPWTRKPPTSSWIPTDHPPVLATAAAQLFGNYHTAFHHQEDKSYLLCMQGLGQHHPYVPLPPPAIT